MDVSQEDLFGLQVVPHELFEHKEVEVNIEWRRRILDWNHVCVILSQLNVLNSFEHGIHIRNSQESTFRDSLLFKSNEHQCEVSVVSQTLVWNQTILDKHQQILPVLVKVVFTDVLGNFVDHVCFLFVCFDVDVVLD